MAKVSIATMERAAQIDPPEGTGERSSVALFNRASDPIHLSVHRLGPSATVTLAGEPSDLALFIWQGSVVAGDTTLADAASAVVEFGATLSLRAGSEGATLLAFHSRERGTDTSKGGRVHLLAQDRVVRTNALGGTPGIGGALHADSGCPSCNVWLHENSYEMADKETTVHSHSEDEVIFVHSGSVRLGRRLYGPGTAIAVAADTLYGFVSGPDGLGFVNFRSTSPTYRSGDGATVLDEADLWRRLLGRPTPEYLGAAG